jgi:hypothetical protein
VRHTTASVHDYCEVFRQLLSFCFDASILFGFIKSEVKISAVNLDDVCSNTTRHVTATNKLVYGWGDKTATPSLHSNCACGFKHHFYDREYDNLPKM